VDYLLFTYPNCQKCEAIKQSLLDTGFEGKEYILAQRESKLKIREYLGIVKRDDKGGIILPTLIFQEKGEVVEVINTQEELGHWLKSRG
jgi:glutaredoxin